MTYPNFLIIGTQKAGTSWVRNMLMQHPDIFMPDYEVHYFDRSDNFAQGPAWYATHFSAVRGEKAIGEKTPNYMMLDKDDPQALPLKIHDLLPDARLIAILRNPVERAISAINHHIRVGYLPPDVNVDEAVQQFIAEDAGFIRYGYYYQHLMNYQQLFDPAQMLVLIYEDDVVGQPLATLQRICRFLEVDPDFAFTGLDAQVNTSRASDLGLWLARLLPLENHLALRLISRAEQLLGRRGEKKRPGSRALDYLYEVYAPENARLFELIGREVTSWAKTDAYITR